MLKSNALSKIIAYLCPITFYLILKSDTKVWGIKHKKIEEFSDLSNP